MIIIILVELTELTEKWLAKIKYNYLNNSRKNSLENFKKFFKIPPEDEINNYNLEENGNSENEIEDFLKFKLEKIFFIQIIEIELFFFI